jgi:multidrug efflux pump subunit AcrA (membrane-fusion protein)
MKGLRHLFVCSVLLAVAGCDPVAAAPAVPTVEVELSESFVRRVRAEGYLEASKATPISAPQDWQMPMKVKWMAEEGASVSEGEVVVRFDPTDIQRQLEDSLGDLESAQISIRKEEEAGKSALMKRDQAAAQAGREIDSAKTFEPLDDGLLSRHELADAQIDIELAQAKADHAGSVKRVERAATRSKVQVLEIKRRSAQSEVKRAEDALPLVSDMQAALFVLEADAGDLEEGLRAEVVIEAYPDKTYPATIKRIDALAQPKHHEVPVQYFGVVLGFESTDASTMKVGQRVRATMFIEQAGALVVPRQAVFEAEGHFFVHKKRGDGFERSEVELGPSSAGRVVIEKGVSAGDHIALRDPDQSVDALLDAAKSGDAKGEAD